MKMVKRTIRVRTHQRKVGNKRVKVRRHTKNIRSKTNLGSGFRQPNKKKLKELLQGRDEDSGLVRLGDGTEFNELDTKEQQKKDRRKKNLGSSPKNFGMAFFGNELERKRIVEDLERSRTESKKSDKGKARLIGQISILDRLNLIDNPDSTKVSILGGKDTDFEGKKINFDKLVKKSFGSF